MDLDARILVTGQCDWVGNAVARRLWAAGFSQVRFVPSDEVKLTRTSAAERMVFEERPAYVFLTAAQEGTGSGEAVRESMAVQANVIHAAWRADVRKLCFLASSSIYPVGALPPLRESALLSSAVEPGEDGEALAQIAGIRLCQVYRRQYRLDAISVVPEVLYGPGDGAGGRAGSPAALVQRLIAAQQEGLAELAIEPTPARAWLQVDDFADAALFLMRRYTSEVPVNVDGGEPVAFDAVARLVADAVGYRGRLRCGLREVRTPRPMPEGVRLNGMGWAPCMPLRHGIEQLCAWYLSGAGTVVV